MNSQIAEQLKRLIETEQWDEVKSLLSQFFNEPQSSVERGAVYAGLIGLYFDIATKINKAHAAKLDEILTSLKQIQSAQNAAQDEYKLMEVEDKMKKAKAKK